MPTTQQRRRDLLKSMAHLARSYYYTAAPANLQSHVAAPCIGSAYSLRPWCTGPARQLGPVDSKLVVAAPALVDGALDVARFRTPHVAPLRHFILGLGKGREGSAEERGAGGLS